MVKELFDYMDYDKDGLITYADLTMTIGKEITPMGGAYFRSNAIPNRCIPCRFDGCWENTIFNAHHSQYCNLHQNIIRNEVIQFFSKLALSMEEDIWDMFSTQLKRKNCLVTIG